MNDAWSFDENGEPVQSLNNGPKPLRDAYEAQKKANDALIARLAALETQVTKNLVADLIESQGVARSAAQHYKGEADPEKVTSWVNDMRTTFGGATAQDTQTVQPILNTDDQKRFEQMNQMGSNAAPAGNMDAANAAVSNASSREELLAAFANLRA